MTLRVCLASVAVAARPVQTGRYLPLVLVVVAAAVVTVVMAHWLTRRAMRRLADLAEAASRVAAGDLSARAPVLGTDEVGRLGETFNRMTRELRAYGEALTASRSQLRGHLSLLGDTLSSTHDLQEMLAVMLRAALAATGARAGVVLLADPAEGVLVGQCGQGLADRGADEWPLRLPLGAGLLGKVALSGQPVRGRVERDAPALALGEPCGRTYIAVPFASQRVRPPERAAQPVLGVLALYDRLGSDEFDEEDQEMLAAFAASGAVAVQNVRVHDEAQRLSYTDPLTGLYNYRMLGESLRRESERSTRFGHRLCLLVLDLDRFKEVNDSYGHAAGDAVLAEFARRLRAEVREVDLAFRQGGEEFVLLLPETDAQGGAALAERLGTAMRGTAMTVTARRIPDEQRHAARIGRQPDRPLRQPDGPHQMDAMRLPDRSHEAEDAARTLRIPVTVSIGIAVFPDHGATGAAVLDAADDALYVAKAAGRDTYRVATMSRVPMPAPAPASPAVPAPPSTPSTAGGGGAPPLSAGDSINPHTPRQSRGR